MAQEFNQIISLLEDLKALNSSNAESIRNLAKGITDKQPLLKNKNSLNLLKSYCEELVKSVEKTYEQTNKSFKNVENSFNEIYTLNGNEKNPIMSKNLNDFFELNNSIQSILKAAKTNINEIKKDSKVIADINSKIDELNNQYKKLLQEILSDLELISNNFNENEWKKKKTNLKQHIEIIEKELKNIQNVLQNSNTTNSTLCKLLSNIITGENLKLTRGMIESIIEKTNNIYKQVTKNHKPDSGDKTESKIENKKLKRKAEEIIGKTNGIKQALGKVTQNIDSMPDTHELEKKLQDMYQRLENLSYEIISAGSKINSFDVSAKVTLLKEDFSTIKNIVSDLNEILTAKMENAITNISSNEDTNVIRDNITKIITGMPKKEEIKSILTKKQKEKEALNKLVEKTDELADRVENLPSNTSSITEDVNASTITDVLEEKTEPLVSYDKEFDHIYGKTGNMENWLVNSNIKEHKDEPSEKTSAKEKENISSVLKTTEQIVEKLENIANNTTSSPVNENISNIGNKLEQLKNELLLSQKQVQEDIFAKLEKKKDAESSAENQKFDELRKDLIEAQNSAQEKLLARFDDFNNLFPKNEDNNKFELFKKEILESVKDSIDSKINIKDEDTTIIKDDCKLEEFKEEILEKLSHVDTAKELNLSIEGIRTEILNSQDIHQDNIISRLSELSSSCENIVSAREFSDFGDELKTLLNQIIANTQENSELETLKKELSSRLDGIDFSDIDFSDIKNEINEGFKDVKELIDSLPKDNGSEGIRNDLSEIKKIIANYDNSDIRKELTSLTEYLSTNLNVDTDEIKNNLTDLKELILNKKSAIEESHEKNFSIINSIEKYFSEIKEALTNDNTAPDVSTIEKLNEIETKITENQTRNTNIFDRITEKLDDYNKLISNQEAVNKDISSSVSEISEIKEKINELGTSFENINTSNLSEEKITEFVSASLSGLGKDLDELKDNIENNIQQGFTYNSELIEEKTSTLLGVIKDLRHASTGNIELFERLTVTDNKLMDFKQELELINTDITGILNSKTDTILEGLESIKNSFKESVNSKTDTENLKELLEEIHLLLKNNKPIVSDDKNSADYSGLENTYNSIAQKLDDSENRIRDFIITDIDSVIIKVDNIKEYLTDKLESMIPPNAKEMKEFNKFISKISDFKQDIESLINESLDAHNEEIKSMLTVALNNREILDAIKELKEYFSKHTRGINISSNEDEDNLEIVEGYEYSAETVNDLMAEFDKFAKQIDVLSGQNTDIEIILNGISDRVKDIGTKNFNFAKAFDLLINDITKIKDSVESIMGTSQNSKESLSVTPSDIEKLLNNVKKEWLEEIKGFLSNDEIHTIIKDISDKVDIIAISTDPDNEDLKSVKSLLDVLNTKVDIIASSDNLNDFEDVRDAIENIASENRTNAEQNKEIRNIIEALSEKVDEISKIDHSEKFDDISLSEMQITSLLETLNSKVDIIAQSDPSEKIDILSDSDEQITSMLETLNHKIDIIAQTDSDSANDENFEDIRKLILEQKDYIDKLEPSKKLEAFKRCLDELTTEVNNVSTEQSEDLQKTLKDMKESIMDAVVTIFNQVSFIEETEDIKDFVEERTSKIAKDLEEVTRQIKQISSSDDSEDYNYSMQDIETDLAKLRLALNDLQNSTIESQTGELNNIADTLNRITYSVDTLTQDEIQNLKTDITNLKDQTKQLLLSSDASFTTLNTDIVHKVDNVAQLLEKSNNSDKVMRQALIYMGEWIDSASESMNKISSNSDEIINIKSKVEELKNAFPDYSDVLSSIEGKFDEQQEHLSFVEKQISKFANIEARFEQQEERIDRLEANLEKILSVVEDIDNSGLMRKVEKIDKQLTKLSSNIEKLASYVD